MMVDRAKRDKAAVVLSALLNGNITNDQFMSAFPRSSDDPALRAILLGAWMQFSDLRAYKLVGRDEPTPERRELLERCCLFLGTDIEFGWPKPKPRIGSVILRLVGIGGRQAVLDEEYKSHGDFDVWPFLRRGDYEVNARKP
jgi:hypothetical protein